MSKGILLIARLLLAHMFLFSGINKIMSYEASAQYMAAGGVPGALLPAVILLEVLGAVMLIIGFKTRWAAWGLAGFSILTALLYHLDFGNQMQIIMLMKNLTIAGGLVVLAEHGPGKLSIDKN